MRKIGFILVSVTILLFSCTKEEKEEQDQIIDLFVWAGQSNALGRQGDASGYPTDTGNEDGKIKFNWTRIDSGNSNGWTVMAPQTGMFAAGHFGPEVTFSRKALRDGYKPAIFKYTKGATSIFEHWKKPGEGGFYDDMIVDLNTAITELNNLGFTIKIKGFIWIQGESDSNSNEAANAYFNNLTSIINGVRNVANDSALPVVLGVDEQFFDIVGHEQPQVLNAHQNIAMNDDNIKFTSMYGYPKADVTHLTPEGLISHGEAIFDTYKLLISGNKPSANCTLSSNGSVVSILTMRAWGQSFSTNCSGKLKAITFRAASNLNNSATFTIHNGADCSGTLLYTQNLNSIITGDNTINVSEDLYMDKNHTYYMNISSDTGTGWKVNYSNTNNVFGNLKTNKDGESNTSCRRSFLNFDLNFSVELIE